MRHKKKHGMKIGTDASHTRAMKRSLVCALFENDRIKTTLPKAKAMRRDVDRVVTWAKKGDIHSRRLAIALIGDKELVREAFEKAAQGMWADRNGGYTRILKLGKRKGDNAEIAIVELVQEPLAKPEDQKKTTKKVSKVSKASKAKKDKVDKADKAAEKPAKDEAAEDAEKDEAAKDGATEDAQEAEQPEEAEAAQKSAEPSAAAKEDAEDVAKDEVAKEEKE